MIYTGITLLLACLTFAFYNALSIKGLTNTHLWHASQYATIILFLLSGVKDRTFEVFDLLYNKDFHNFGRRGTLLALVIIVSITAYVYSLHYFLPIIEGLNG